MHLSISQQRGFTLVEVIVALLVAGVSLVSLFLVYEIGTRNSGVSVEAQRADMLAASYAEELLHSPTQWHSELGDDGDDGESRDKTPQSCASAGQFDLTRSDQPPVLFAQPYMGPNDIYAQFKVDVSWECLPASIRDIADVQKLRLTIHGAGGQSYEYSMLRRLQ